MRAATIVLGLLTAGCGSAGELYHDPAYRQREVLKTSLIKDEKAILSEDSIQRLLSSQVQLPPKAKLAVFAFPHKGAQAGDLHFYPASYAVDLSFLQDRREYLSALEEPLLKTGRFVEITHVPSILLPAEPSLTRLREAAALMQSDLLLVYSTRSELVTVRWLFLPNEAKVHSWIEFCLVDVKTGAVPYAETFEDLHTELQSKEDDRIAETQRRGEKVGTLHVLQKAAEGLKIFIGRR